MLFNSFTSFQVYAKISHFDYQKFFLRLYSISIEKIWLEYNYDETIRQVQIKGHLQHNWPRVSRASMWNDTLGVITVLLGGKMSWFLEGLSAEVFRDQVSRCLHPTLKCFSREVIIVDRQIDQMKNNYCYNMTDDRQHEAKSSPWVNLNERRKAVRCIFLATFP